MKGKGSEGDNELCLFYYYITNAFLLYSYCRMRKGEEGVLTAFLVCSYCLLIVLRLEGEEEEEEEEGRRQGMLIVVVSY